MSGMDVHFSSADSTWETPQDFFEQIAEVFPFTVDVCASPMTAKCDMYFTPEDDMFSQSFAGHVFWMNPPYGDPEHPCKKNCKKKRCVVRGHHIDQYVPGIIDFMRYAFDQNRDENQRCSGVCLVPARVDTEWWHEYAADADEIVFIRGRLKFGDSESSAPFPSALIIYHDVALEGGQIVWHWDKDRERFKDAYAALNYRRKKIA